nr:hypothetical protein [Sedimentibacter sp.]
MKKIRQAILNGLKTIPKLMPDILAFSGAITMSYGAYLIYKPVGFIVLGVMFIISAVILSKS